MPVLVYLAIGALAGAGTTYVISDTAKTAIKWGAIAGAGYVGYKLFIAKK